MTDHTATGTPTPDHDAEAAGYAKIAATQTPEDRALARAIARRRIRTHHEG